MATLTKMDMIKALVEANKVDELKKEKDNSTKLAARMFRTLSNDRVKELYAARIVAEPEKVIKEITKKAEKAAAPASAQRAFKPCKDREGKHTYKKRWMYEELENRSFSPLNSNNKRVLSGAYYVMFYDIEKNLIIVRDPKHWNKVIAKNYCICPFITKAFIDKYLAMTPKTVE